MKVMFSMYDDVNDCAAPKTLCDWVKNFRMKKIQMKRKLRTGGDLRVCAIMATALLSAENQLRLKQQERLNRCLQLQSKFHDKLSGSTPTTNHTIMSMSAAEYDAEEQKQRIEICNLWKDELNGLDEFMRKMSSHHHNLSTNNNHNSDDIYSSSNDIDDDGSCSSSKINGNSTCSASAYRFSDDNEATTVRQSIVVSS